MPTCPGCGKNSTRRKQERCRYCGVPIFPFWKGRGKHKTKMWVTEKAGCGKLVNLTQSLIRLRDGTEFEFVYRLQELGAAKHLLDLCDGNQALAREVIETHFDSDARRTAHVWTTPMSVCAIISKHCCISEALAYAKTRVVHIQVAEEINQCEMF